MLAASASMPTPLDRWCLEILGRNPPAEPRSDCDNCPMCSNEPAAGAPPPELRFSRSKCCTYAPILPSFNVGWILGDHSEALRIARQSIERAIAEHRSITPVGLLPSPLDTRSYRSLVKRGEFGRASTFSCPYFQASSMGCGIWPYRNVACSTFFCRYQGGAPRMRFWRWLRTLLWNAAGQLALHLAMELEVGDETFGELLLPAKGFRMLNITLRGFVDAEGRMEPALARRVWGAWFGREMEFYRRCAERAHSMTWQEVRALGGAEQAILERMVRRSFENLDRTPDTLVLGPVAVEGEPGSTAYLRTAVNEFDGVHLAPSLVEALGAFDGRPVKAARAEAEARSGVIIDDDLLERLVDASILVEPDGRDIPPSLERKGPIEPKDRLRFFRGYCEAEVALDRLADPEGHAFLVIGCGSKEFTIDDPELFGFAQELVDHAHGFEASAAMGWGTGLTWERASELLGSLVEEGILQRV